MSSLENINRISADSNTIRNADLSHINSFDTSGEDMEIWRELRSINANSDLPDILPSVSYINYEKPDQVDGKDPGNRPIEDLGDRFQPPRNNCIPPRELPVDDPGELGLAARQLRIVYALCEIRERLSR